MQRNAVTPQPVELRLHRSSRAAYSDVVRGSSLCVEPPVAPAARTVADASVEQLPEPLILADSSVLPARHDTGPSQSESPVILNVVSGASADAVAKGIEWIMGDADHLELFRGWRAAGDPFAEPPRALQGLSLTDMRTLLADKRLSR